MLGAIDHLAVLPRKFSAIKRVPESCKGVEAQDAEIENWPERAFSSTTEAETPTSANAWIRAASLSSTNIAIGRAARLS